MLQKASRYGYLFFASVFLVGILMQVFFIGLSLLGGQPSWEAHELVGHSLSLAILPMLLLAYLGRMDRPVKPLTWLDFGVYVLLILAVTALRGIAPPLAALHPVLAVIMFSITAVLVSQAWQAVRAPERASSSVMEPGAA